MVKLIKLGQKGAKPARPHKNPRPRKAALTPVETFAKHAKISVTRALQIHETYHSQNNEKHKESILVYWISTNGGGTVEGIPERLARNFFGIGSHKFTRLRNGEAKKKPGGRKPNSVSCFENYVALIFRKSLMDHLFTSLYR